MDRIDNYNIGVCCTHFLFNRFQIGFCPPDVFDFYDTLRFSECIEFRTVPARRTETSAQRPSPVRRSHRIARPSVDGYFKVGTVASFVSITNLKWLHAADGWRLGYVPSSNSNHGTQEPNPLVPQLTDPPHYPTSPFHIWLTYLASSSFLRCSSSRAAWPVRGGAVDRVKSDSLAILDGDRSSWEWPAAGEVGVDSRGRFSELGTRPASCAKGSAAAGGGSRAACGARGVTRGASVAMGPCSDAMSDEGLRQARGRAYYLDSDRKLWKEGAISPWTTRTKLRAKSHRRVDGIDGWL